MLPENESCDSLFVFDLDGTLVHSNSLGERKIPSSLLSCVNSLAKCAPVIVATGRRYRSAKPVAALIEGLEFVVCHNGLMVRSMSDETLFRKGIQWEIALELSLFLEGFSLEPILVLDGLIEEVDFVISRESYLRCTHARQLSKKHNQAVLEIPYLKDLSKNFHSSLLEVACLGPYQKLVEAQQKMQELLPEGFRSVVVKNCGYGDLSVMEICCAVTSKWTGIELLKNKFQSARVFAFGDDENDLEMLQLADVGVVMSHAPEHVKKIADVEVDGAKGLEEFLKTHL